MNSAVVKAEDLRYSDEGVRDILKSIIIPLWNAYSFFVTYANIDQIFPAGPPEDPDNPLDRWVLSAAESLVEEVTKQLDAYDLTKAVDPIVTFIDQLNNWYIRRSRRRFWRSENDGDKEQAYQTLYAVLVKISLVAAPIIPFITEEMYQNLKNPGMPESIHHCDYPVPETEKTDKELERKMEITQTAVSLGRAIRSMHNLKIRQPLKALHLVTRNPDERRILREMEDIIREELNVKDVIFRENEEDVVEYSAKPNYRILGKELGKHMKDGAKKIEALSPTEIQSLLEGNVLNIDLGPISFDLTKENVEVRRSEKENLKVLNEGSLTVALDPEITEELKQEGMVRDVIRGVQNLRKDQGLEVTDRIDLFLDGDGYVKQAVESFQDYLMNETLSVSLTWQKMETPREIECGEEKIFASLRKSDEA
jgi:isoleucyl-tRNA synthetase